MAMRDTFTLAGPSSITSLARRTSADHARYWKSGGGSHGQRPLQKLTSIHLIHIFFQVALRLMSLIAASRWTRFWSWFAVGTAGGSAAA